MAQYFVAVNHTKREWMHPHRFGDGLKWPELCGSSHGMLSGLAHTLKAPNGRWVGDDVAIVGDYDSSEQYDAAMDSYKDISFIVMREMAEDPYARATMVNKVAWVRDEPTNEALYKEIFGE